MKRTDAIQALRERFTDYNGSVTVCAITREEAAALGVFDQADDDGWIEWNPCHGAVSPLLNDETADVETADGERQHSGEILFWNDEPMPSRMVIRYRPHRED